MIENNNALSDIKNNLDKASEELNKRIIKFEQELNHLGLGVHVWIKTSDELSLGYGKYDGNWGLVVKLVDKLSNEEVFYKLTNAPRGIRLHSYKHFNQLTPALLEVAKSLTEKINKELNNETS